VSPEELNAAIAAFQVLEPMAQQGIAALIHKLHKKELTAADYLAMAAKLLPQVAAKS